MFKTVKISLVILLIITIAFQGVFLFQPPQAQAAKVGSPITNNQLEGSANTSETMGGYPYIGENVKQALTIPSYPPNINDVTANAAAK